jgi:uncharacterized protein YkwD
MQMKSAVWPLATIIVFLLLSVQIAAASGFEDELLILINRYRKTKQLKPLVSSPLYSDLAVEHSQTMQEQGRMSHDGFEERFQRATDARSCVENLGWNHQTAQSLFDAWKKSPGHNSNMLKRKLRRAGIGKEGAYVTLFVCY